MRLASALACVIAALGVRPSDEPGSGRIPPQLAILDRQISQHNSRWLVRYHVRYDGDESQEFSAGDLAVDYEAWVANSRCRPHALPRRSEAHFVLSEASPVSTSVIVSSNERLRCRERIALAVTTGDEPAADTLPAKHTFLPVQLTPGQNFWVYLSLEHEHFLHGTYDPLFGERQVEIRLGPCRLFDTIPLDREVTPATPQARLSTVPKERLDQRQFHSAPDSLYLAADVPGYQYFRFDDMPVRYGTSFRLSFWYLVAVGSEGDSHVRVMEYQDTPSTWKRLDDGGFDETLAVQGRWEKFEQTFTASDETTTMALDFRITGANIGELWIDDVELVALYSEVEQRPEARVEPPIRRASQVARR